MRKNLEIVLAILVVSLMANLNALVDVVFHPEISYFDKEHLIVGGVTALAIAILLIYGNRLSRDITKRKNTEEKFRQSEQRFRDLIESTTDWIWEVDRQGVYTYASPNVIDLLGYEPAEIIGKTPFDLMPEEEAEKIRSFFKEKVINKEPFYGIGNVNLHKDGHLVVLETNGVPIFDQKGELKGYRGIDRDITERKKAEEILRQATNYLENLINHTNAPIIIWDSEFKITRVNLAFELFTGYTAAEVIGQKLHMLFPKETEDKSLGKIERALNGEYWKSVEIPILCKDGDIKIALWNSANIYAEDGKTLLSTMAQGQDITERKMMEEELEKHREHLEREVEARTRELKESQAVLIQAEKMAGLGTLAGGIAHEVNNPLGSILTYAQLIGSKFEDGTLTLDKAVKYAGKIEQVTMHCKAAIQNLLDFSRESKDTAPFSLSEVIDASVSLLFHQLRLQSVKVLKEVDDITIVANKNQLMQVFVNMLTNAGDVMPKGGEINIAAQKLDGHIKIVISDTGAGIPEENLDKIYDPFFTTKETGKGTGLGLYLCYRIVKNLGGTIEVESEVGKGTTFIIKLPV